MSYDAIQSEEDYTIYDVFKNLVDLVKADTDLPKITQFIYGYWFNATNELVSSGRSSKLKEISKYPLIFVHADFKEKRGESLDVLAEINPKIYIFAETDANYEMSDRLSEIFSKILYPTYNILIEKMQTCNYFKLDYSKNKYPDIQHEKKDLYYISSEGDNQNQLNECVDAIELYFPKLFIKNNLKFN